MSKSDDRAKLAADRLRGFFGNGPAAEWPEVEKVAKELEELAQTARRGTTPEVEQCVKDRLDEQEFYEVCQLYRHAPDLVAPHGMLTASEAFEYLKGWVRGYASSVRSEERERCAKQCDQEREQDGTNFGKAALWRAADRIRKG